MNELMASYVILYGLNCILVAIKMASQLLISLEFFMKVIAYYKYSHFYTHIFIHLAHMLAN